MNTATANIWLDEYTGTVYTYAMQFRPAQCGITCPRDGYLMVMANDPIRYHARYPHGKVFYSRKLTENEMTAYQMVQC
jgi:hypothetical protein